MADLSFLFGSNPPSTYLSPVETTSSMPQWYQEAMRGLVTQAAGIANEPYTPYGGPRVAGLNPLQQSSIQNAGQAGTSGASTLNSAAGLAGNAGWTQFKQADFNKFLSPYTEGVVDRIGQLGQRNLAENILPEINQSFIGSGMPFGSRHADFTARAARDTNESIMGAQSNALQQSYDSAMGNYQNALQRQGQTAGIMAGIGTGQTQNQMQAGGYQQIMGGIQQQNQQQNLDTAYQDFLRQQQYPQDQLNTVNSILRGYAPYQPSNTQSYVGSPNQTSTTPANSALGALSTFFGQGR